MAVLPVRRASATGSALTTQAAAGGGDSFPNDGNTNLLVINSGGAPRTVTFDAPNACSFGVVHASHDYVATIPNDSVPYQVGPFSKERFNDVNDRVQVTYDSATGVAVAAVAR